MKFKKLFIIAILGFSPLLSWAQTPSPTVSPMLDRLKTVGTGGGYTEATDTTLMEIIGIIINTFLALLGVIFVVLIILAGYNWMTAQGEEEKITKAKDTIKASIIGLIIVVGAFAIWAFVSNYLVGGTTGELPSGGGQ